MDVREKLVELLYNSPQLDVLGGLSYYEEAADHLIANGVTVQEWIPVTERFPCVDTMVLVYDARGGDTHTATFDGTLWHLDGGWLLDADDFTHWMPLPPAPEDMK